MKAFANRVAYRSDEQRRNSFCPPVQPTWRAVLRGEIELYGSFCIRYPTVILDSSSMPEEGDQALCQSSRNLVSGTPRLSQLSSPYSREAGARERHVTDSPQISPAKNFGSFWGSWPPCTSRADARSSRGQTQPIYWSDSRDLVRLASLDFSSCNESPDLRGSAEPAARERSRLVERDPCVPRSWR